MAGMARGEGEAEDDGLDMRRVEAILEAVGRHDTADLTRLLDPLHAADIADLLEQISPTDRNALLQMRSDAIDGDVLSELDDSIREDVIDPSLQNHVFPT